MAAIPPRAVFVTRDTDYELLLARHATRGQAKFFLESRGQRLSEVDDRHASFQAVLGQARVPVPGKWRQALARRSVSRWTGLPVVGQRSRRQLP
jgi:hypothetical protein